MGKRRSHSVPAPWYWYGTGRREVRSASGLVGKHSTSTPTISAAAVDVPIAAVGKSKSNALLRLVAAELGQGS